MICILKENNEQYEKILNLINDSTLSVETSISIMKSVFIMLNKNKLCIPQDQQKQIIGDMINLLRESESIMENLTLLKDQNQLIDLILFIIGISKSHFHLIKDYGVSIGLVSERVEILFNLLWKYRDLIFRNGVCNIPKIAQLLSTENITSASSFAITAAKEEIRKAIKEGASDLISIVKKNASNLDKTIKEQVEKVSKLMPEKIEINGIYLCLNKILYSVLKLDISFFISIAFIEICCLDL